MDDSARHRAPVTGGWPRGLLTAPGIAGAIYVLSWIAGLLIFSSSVNVTSSGADVIVTFGGHGPMATAQYALTEGLPALALAVVVWSLAAASGTVAPSVGCSRLMLIAGLLAAAVSLVQFVLGVILVAVTVPDGKTGAAKSIFDAINRLDGVKMLLLAVFAIAGFLLVRDRRLLLPAWLGYVAAVLVVAIIVSGIGYLLLVNGLALAAWVSLPLLLIWVGGAGIALGLSGGTRAWPIPAASALDG